ncbi:MAG TPA: VTT domain-containing protein [Candidatus Hydrogenedentes bacterium]|nr:VTT domain-containing protein [Candidatus Hydrogenedentota bacterium]
MIEWIAQSLQQLSGSPWLQGIVAALATFVLEDPTTITCGVLVAEGRMAFLTAFVGLTLGIALGDLGLYAIGRFAGPLAKRWGWLSDDKLSRVQHWFDRNIVLAVIASRFLPGTRLPTYVGAGVFQASPVRFVCAALVASLVWTLILLSATVKLGEAVLPYLGKYRWPAVIVFILFIIVAQRQAAKRIGNSSSGKPVVSTFEFWHPAVFYFPVGLYYAWLAIRFRGITLPTASNPSIYSGGLIRESKSQILSLVGADQQHYVGRYCTFSRAERLLPLHEATRAAKDTIEVAKLAYPLVAKPDQGQRGAGVQRIFNDVDLQNYLDAFPEGADIVFQELIDYPHEAGVMYCCHPATRDPQIISITIKEFPELIGDGVRTVRELIQADPRARILQHVYCRRHADKLEHVPENGERFPLVFAGNHAHDTIFKDGTHLVTPQLMERLHEISSSMPDFYFGRFDIRYRDLESFLLGENLRIVEINGAGAESTHIWDATMTLDRAYRALFRQWRLLFEIGAANRARGVRPLGPIQVLRDCWSYRALSRDYPMTH